MPVDTEVTFQSERFRPVLPDVCQVNPGRFGAELAYWLCTELMKAGVVTSYPNHEDWGWFIEYTSETEDEYWLCCSNIDGTEDEWVCFLQPKRRGILTHRNAPLENARPLLTALVELLESEPSVHNICWSRGRG